MKKKLKPTHVLLAAFIIFCLLLLPIAFFNLSFTLFFVSKLPYVIPFVVLSILFSMAFLKNRLMGGLFILFFLLFISFILIIIKVMENADKEEVEWNSANDRFTTGFIVGKEGHIFITATINDSTGLFLFDTGAGLSLVNEKFVTDKKMKLHPYTINDAKGIEQTKNVFKVKSFRLEAIEIKQLHVYPNDSLSWTLPKGAFYKQDSIFGVIGNNIISNFSWDFDMVNRLVTVSNSKAYCDTIPDSLSVDLIAADNHKEIAVLINGENKMLTLDFGSCFPIVISDSIPNRQLSNGKGNFSQHTKGALNHLDTTTSKASNFNFVDIQVGANTFKEIKCFENDHSNLLGIPFIWAFKRVVIDFGNDKAYFITENENSGDFGLNKHNRQSFWTSDGLIEMKKKPGGMVYIITADSTKETYVLYGNLKFYKSNNRIDSIFCEDSLKMPDGQVKNRPSTLRFEP